MRLVLFVPINALGPTRILLVLKSLTLSTIAEFAALMSSGISRLQEWTAIRLSIAVVSARAQA